VNTSQSSQNIQKAVPFFAVANIEASVKYYVDGLGFKMTKQWTPKGKLEWCWLERDNAALMLQEFHPKGHDSWVPKGPLGTGVSICFICDDALTIYREITAKGISATRPMVSNNMWNFGLTDPDGYRLEFESDTDVPEGTELSE